MTTPSTDLQACIDAAAELISDADGLLITAGAGIGIDSGLPDFRGDHGFWKAYPALGKLGTRFVDIANPAAFVERPKTAWGFYGHRLLLYRNTVPHEGFRLFLDIARTMPHGAFVFTSNVDGQFQKAGFDDDHVAECHGSIHHLQCTRDCDAGIWPADAFQPEVDDSSCRLTSPLPACPDCGALARPNILMFGDWEWNAARSQKQQSRLHAWLTRVQRPVVVEIGAGTAIPTVRQFGAQLGCPIIRINPAESQVGSKHDIGLPLGALGGMRRIAHALAALK
jgi:NAD-dependent SIR2 family protein deacetylase